MPRLARDLGVAVLGFALILGVVYTLGRVAVPAFPQALGDVDLSPTTEGAGSTPLTIEQMRAEVTGDDYNSAALLQIEGAVEGTFHLELTDYREWLDTGVDEGPTLDLDMRFYSAYDAADPSFTVTARGLEVGTPRTDRYTVLVSSGADSFLAKSGECAIDLLDLRFTTAPPAFGSSSTEDRTMPVFLVQVVCHGVTALRGDQTVSFMVVLEYAPDELTEFG